MRVLFIGNSHTYFNDMPALFAAFCRHGGVDTEVTMLSHSGQSLEWHRKEYFETRFNILHGHYDICILQQHAHPFPDPEVTGKTVGEFIALCRAAGTRPALLMTWAEKAHPEDQAIMIEVYQKMAAEHDALLIPVGQVWTLPRRTRGRRCAGSIRRSSCTGPTASTPPSMAAIWWPPRCMPP